MYNIKIWIRISLLNILLVAFLGLLMRYKIAFYLPFIDQKNLLHAHSHFAFAGWISQTLYVLIIQFFLANNAKSNYKKFTGILIANLFCSYFMIINFAIQGYGFISIILSCISIIIFYIFCILSFQELKKGNKKNHVLSKWLKAGLLFGILSTFGTLMLAYSMQGNMSQKIYLGSLYFYLHFQYNGWFLFASIACLYQWLQKNITDFQEDKKVFMMFFISCIPCYFLSILWAKLPLWLYIIVVTCTILQTIGWLFMLENILRYKKEIQPKLHKTAYFIFILVAIAYTIKIFLQLASTIPYLSHLAFGFRPIVIAYLHLILLGVFSLYLVGIFIQQKYIQMTHFATISIYSFILGVFFNEFVLMIQGTGLLMSKYISHTEIYLFIVACILFISLVCLLVSQLNIKISESK